MTPAETASLLAMEGHGGSPDVARHPLAGCACCWSCSSQRNNIYPGDTADGNLPSFGCRPLQNRLLQRGRTQAGHKRRHRYPAHAAVSAQRKTRQRKGKTIFISTLVPLLIRVSALRMSRFTYAGRCRGGRRNPLGKTESCHSISK